ncbi:hypothetical protein [Streptomyces sp. NPDC058665]|uniref:hypothetical protein n=1 Tax=Streptomyces sp. NPDC058665 TaxID=3346586 RepID=UPI003658B13A
MRSRRHRTTRTGVVGLAVAALAATAFTVPAQASSGGSGGNGGSGQTAGRPAGQQLAPKQLKAMKTTVFDSGYGLGIEQLTASCGTEVWGHGGGWIGSLSYAATTGDGGHAFAVNLNGDWRSDGVGAVMEAEFCGAAD